jgi:hypothetical protein
MIAAEGASGLRDKDQAQRRLHLSSEHLVAQVGKEIDDSYVAGFHVTSEDIKDECIGLT